MSAHPGKQLALLHGTVFLWGFTAILGALISLNALHLVWWRMLLAFLFLGAFLWFKFKSLRPGGPPIKKLLGIGVLVAAHWLTFYGCIKVSTVSVALVCLSASTLFAALLAPFFKKNRKILWIEGITGVLIVVGISMIFHFETQYKLGIFLGIISAFFAAWFTLLNENEIRTWPASLISFYEMLGGWLVLCLYMLGAWIIQGQVDRQLFRVSAMDWVWLVIMASVCTALAFVLGVYVMKSLKAYTVVLTTNLEPLYGILLAFVIFGEAEQMTPGFYAGSVVILAAVFSYPVVNRWLNRRAVPDRIL